MHLRNLSAAVETVPTLTVNDKFKLVFRQVVVFGCFQIFFLGNEFFFIESFVLFIRPLGSAHFYLKCKLVLSYREFLLFHRNHGIAQDIFLLSKFRFRVKYLHIKTFIGQFNNDITGIDLTSFLGYDSLDIASFCRADLDCGHRLDLTADADIVIELASLCGSSDDGAAVNSHCRTFPSDYQ